MDSENGTNNSNSADRTKSLALIHKTSKAVGLGRLAFVSCLSVVASVFAMSSYYFLKVAETKLAETQFESIADRALIEANGIALRKRLGTVTMATIAAQILPDADAWPFVTFPGFEKISSRLIETSSGREMGFVPLVTPEQLPDFETFAYNYYERGRIPPFPEGTAGSSFGRGVWGVNDTLDTPDNRYHEADGITTYNSRYRVFAPILHHNAGAFPALMLNLHFQEDRGRAIDSMIECSEKRAISDNPNEFECGVLTDILMLTSQKQGTGPGALLLQPVYPVNNNTKVNFHLFLSLPELESWIWSHIISHPSW